MLEVKYSFEILLISFFKILKYPFEVRVINADFLKENYLFLSYFDDEKFELNYISWFMKKFAFYLFDYLWIKMWLCMIVLLRFVLFMT